MSKAVDHFASRSAEEIVIGCILQAPDLIGTATQVLGVEHFTNGATQTVYRAMLDLVDRNVPIELTLLAERLSSKPDGEQTQLQSVGGVVTLARWESSAISPSIQFEPAVRILTERMSRRGLRRALNTGLTTLAEGRDTADTIADLNAQIERLPGLGGLEDDACNARAIAKSVYADLEAGESHLSGLVTGIGAIDSLLDGGFVPGMHYIVGALSGHGKTTFASALVAGLLARHDDIAVDWHGCEVPAKWQFCRIASSYGDVPERFWRKPSGDSSGVYSKAIEALGWGVELDARLRIFHCAGTIDIRDVALKTAMRRRALDGRTLVVVVDYIQRSSGGGHGTSTSDTVAEASRRVAGLADDQTITIALSQFTDVASNSEPIPMPKPGMARWAKDIHHDACDWITYHRPLLETLPPLAICQLAKSRYGRLAHVSMLGTPSNRFVPFRNPGSDALRACEKLYGVNPAHQQIPQIQGLNTVEIRT